ncbi:MAG: antibiotic biosynthesis monooxygenase [Acetobacteraceae bacterium]|nr:antibiotic biosynthesis monooxygenase [Acetobacteraceae bacterium]
MFAVMFEVQPRPDRWDTYLGFAGALRPELLKIDGFIDNVRYGSKRREGWLLSLSTWRDEKALVRWRTQGLHHQVQGKGRTEVFRDYRLRVGQVTAETPGQRLDETETGDAKLLSIVEMTGPPDPSPDPEAIGRRLGLNETADGLVNWDVFEAILTPGALLLLLAWRDAGSAEAGEHSIPAGARHRRIRVIRDYGMFDRREAPQYYPDAPRR